jgi:hypothetical protein
MMRNQHLISGLKCLIVTLLLSGCDWPTWNVSNEVPFNSYVGINGILKEPMTLREQRKHTYRFVPYTLGGPEHEPISVEERVVCDLSAGTEIKTTSVKMIEVGGRRAIFILGIVKNKGTEEWVEFEILLGGYSATGAKEIHVMRMPWEGNDVPEHRYIPLKKPMPGTDPWAK